MAGYFKNLSETDWVVQISLISLHMYGFVYVSHLLDRYTQERGTVYIGNYIEEKMNGEKLKISLSRGT